MPVVDLLLHCSFAVYRRPWKLPMKSLIHPAITALGLSVLCFLGYISPLTNPEHLWLYQDSSDPASVFVPVLLNVALVWLVLFLVLRAAEKPGRLQVLVWCSFFFAIPLLVVKVVSQVSGVVLPLWLSCVILLAWGLTCGVFLILRRRSFGRAFAQTRTFACSVLTCVGLGAALLLGQTIWCLFQAQAVNTPLALHSPDPRLSKPTSPHKPRVLWIILDELSYQQVYERRFPSLNLPAFDQLAAQSTLFTQVQPAAERTEFAIPSFFTGLRVDDIRAGADGSLRSLHDPLTGAWQPFHAEDTVFHDALDRGYKTAVAGWYIPYCRILASFLDRCNWTYGADADKWMLPGASIQHNILTPWLRIASRFVPNGYTNDQFASQLAATHIADYRWLSAEADKMLQDPSLNFLLLHIPAPHPGGIYDRRTGTFTTHGASYIDNLALADQYLAHVQQLLKSRGEWDATTVIVMGDHSWRTRLLWSGKPDWTAEEQAASLGGQFDPRPAYIVKLPRQTESARIDTPFDAVNTRPLLTAILSGKVQSPTDLASFASNLNQQSLAKLHQPSSR
jgi:hypothetical protein